MNAEFPGLDENTKLDVEAILTDLEHYRPRRKGWTWREVPADGVDLGPFHYRDSSVPLKKSIGLPASRYFGGIDPQPSCVVTTEIASGRFEDDLRRMRMAAWHGADHLMVIRTTGQSHIDGLIEGTPEGVGGVPITRKQIRASRKACDLIEDEVGRPINFHSYVSGVAGPEVAVLFAEEGVNGAHQDPQYNVLYRNVNMYRSFVDAAEAKCVMAGAGIFQIDGAHNANATAKAGWLVMPELMVQHAINCTFSEVAGMPADLIGLSTVPPNSAPAPKLWFDLPYAVALRDVFSDFKMRAQQNTRYIEADIEEAVRTHTVDTLISMLTSADIQSTITPDEGRNVPWHYNNVRGIQTVKQTWAGLDGINDLVSIRRDGALGEMARDLKERTVCFLEEVLETGGYFAAVEAGFFVDSAEYPERHGDGIVRSGDGGVGSGTLTERDADYWAPVCDHFGNSVEPDWAQGEGRPAEIGSLDEWGSVPGSGDRSRSALVGTASPLGMPEATPGPVPPPGDAEVGASTNPSVRVSLHTQDNGREIVPDAHVSLHTQGSTPEIGPDAEVSLPVQGNSPQGRRVDAPLLASTGPSVQVPLPAQGSVPEIGPDAQVSLPVQGNSPQGGVGVDPNGLAPQPGVPRNEPEQPNAAGSVSRNEPREPNRAGGSVADTKPCAPIGGCTFCVPDKIVWIDELDPADSASARLEKTSAYRTGTTIKPEAEWAGDGTVLVQLFVPQPADVAEAYALEMARRMGLGDPVVVNLQVMQAAEGCFCEVKGVIGFDIDRNELVIPVKEELLPEDDLREAVSTLKLRVVAGTVGEDEHSVGMREILDIKHGGIEKYGVKYTWLGTSVPIAKMVDAAIETGAHAILISTIISHNDIHRQMMRKLADLCIEKGVRDRIVLIAGGTQVSRDMASETGLDATFGRGTHGIDVVDAIIKTLRARVEV